MFLTAPEHILQVRKSGTVTTTAPECLVWYVDHDDSTAASGPVASGPQRTVLSAGANVDNSILNPPPKSHSYQVTYLTLYNRDTVTHTLTVSMQLGNVEGFSISFVLASGECAEWNHHRGWIMRDTNGREYITTPGGGGGGGGGIAASAAGASQSAGTVVWSNSNNVTFGMAGSTITASIQPGVSAISAGTTNATSGQVVASNSNNVSFGLNGLTLTATASYQPGVSAVSAGTTRATSGEVVMSNSNNVSFGLNGQTVTATATVARSEGMAISAGTTLASAGTAVFSNSNNVSFGLNGSTVTATASYQPGVSAVSAGTTRATSGEVVWSNSNNISFGLNGQTVTASLQPGVSAASAGTTRATSGELVFSNSNGVSFGINGQTLTASIGAAPAAGVGAISAGTTQATSGTVVFSNSNGISFGLNGQTVTAVNEQVRYLEPYAPVSSRAMGQGTLYIQPFNLSAPMTAHAFRMLMHISNSSSAGGTVSLHVGLYQRTGATLTLLSSASISTAYNSTLATSYTNVSGTRYRNATIGTWNLVPGELHLGVMWTVATGLTSGSYTYMLNRSAVSIVGTGPGVIDMPSGGVYSAATAALPNGISLTQVVSTGSAHAAQPWFALYNTVAP